MDVFSAGMVHVKETGNFYGVILS